MLNVLETKVIQTILQRVKEKKKEKKKAFMYITCFCFIIADIISAVEFDHTGDYLATGDKGGRVVLFERNENVSLIV